MIGRSAPQFFAIIGNLSHQIGANSKAIGLNLIVHHN